MNVLAGKIKGAALFAAILIIAQLAFANITSNTSADAWGGNITQVSFTLNQTSNRWFVFYGYSNGSSTSLTLSSSMIYDSSDSSHLLNLPSTYSYYIISDESSPFDGNYSTPDLGSIDSHFNLRNYESSSHVFDSTANFSVYNSSNDTTVTLSLPTAYFAGKSNGGSTNWQAFRQGIVLKGTSILFIVPSSSATGFDGRTFDFEFALPYDQFGGNSFYIFTIAAPYEPPPTLLSTGGDTPLGSLGFSWAYDGKILTIHTTPGASITLRDSLGASFSPQSESGGDYKFEVPAGFKYYAYLSKSGYDRLDTSLYISLPVKTTGEKEKEDKEKEKPTGEEGETDVTIEQTPSGTIICIGNDCYESEFAEIAKVQELQELSCYGSICKLVGIDGAAFVEKYSLTKSPYQSTRRGESAAALDISKMFSDFGYEVSAGLGSVTAWPEKERGFFFYSFVFFAIAALFVYLFRQNFSRHASGGGYD
ncbi:hypothetical protein COU37_04825 [Candidatus Micrarchaeota archaeon CG10_big_fil_rev_8_21_14_0_10_45_29]|nr:MAG: hypothetical protein COU37_04825 [Candidatus Micrarchaeota archaeon CG10_big_fil_rev_8_21_14_0_10_45_29]